MTTSRIAFACAFAACLLFSCNNKKKQPFAASEITSTTASDTIRLLPDDPLNLTDYNNDYENRITQRFTAPATKVSVITAAKGLKITINPSALEREDGSAIDGKINVQIVEITTGVDLFKCNAATISNGRLLASGGSYFIGMDNNGKKVRIKNGRNILVDFPVIANEEMELFYGERNADSNMNWTRANLRLEPGAGQTDLSFDYGQPDVIFQPRGEFVPGELKLFRTLDEKVFYYSKAMTLRELVDTLNRKNHLVFLDTVYTWPKEVRELPPGSKVDTAYLVRRFGPPIQYFLKTFKSLKDQEERAAREKARRDSLLANWKPRSLAGQLQKYYQPTAVTALGWINCDRFYQYREFTDVELDIPITLNDSRIQIFLLFKSFNGLMNFRIDSGANGKNIFYNLPRGEEVTLIGFSKANGQLFRCKKDFTISKGKAVKLEFENILPEEMTKMFGKNVRI